MDILPIELIYYIISLSKNKLIRQCNKILYDCYNNTKHISIRIKEKEQYEIISLFKYVYIKVILYNNNYNNLLENVYTLDLSWTNIIDVSMLGNVHTLKLSHTNVVDVSMLGNVHTLNLHHTKAAYIATLSNIELNSLII